MNFVRLQILMLIASLLSHYILCDFYNIVSSNYRVFNTISYLSGKYIILSLNVQISLTRPEYLSIVCVPLRIEFPFGVTPSLSDILGFGSYIENLVG
jgi:hypothetical protein